MTPEALQRVRADLIRDEGQRLDLYTDTTGHATIGVGHCLTVHGISQAVCDQLLNEDVARALDEALTASWFRGLNEVRQRVILNMIFNLGLAGVSRFTLMIAAIRRGDYEAAAREMRESLWAHQVGDRAVRLAHLMATGCEPTP